MSSDGFPQPPGFHRPGSDSAGVNAILPGMKVDCVIGLCRVLDFGTATEVRKPRFSRSVEFEDFPTMFDFPPVRSIFRQNPRGLCE
jgi:hypothetical protein